MSKGVAMMVPNDAPKAGEVYRHYKGDNYKVVGMALRSTDDSWDVVYEPLYNGAVFKLFSRPLSEWQEMVEWQGQKVQRFSKL